MKSLLTLLFCTIALAAPIAIAEQEARSETAVVNPELADAPVNPTLTNASAAPKKIDKVPVPAVIGSGVYAANTVSVIGGLFLIVLLIFFVAWVLRRVSAGSLMWNQSITVLASLGVGTREKIMLIEIGDKQLLIGVAPGRVSCLQCFDEKIMSVEQTPSSDFSHKLKNFMQQSSSVNSTSRVAQVNVSAKDAKSTDTKA